MKTLQGTWLSLAILAGALSLAFPEPGRGEPGPADEKRATQTDTAPSTPSAEAEEKAETSTNIGRNETPQDIPKPGRGVNREQVVMFGQNVELKAGDTAEVVVVIGGNAKIHGKVREAVVVIGGDVEIDGEVGEEVVAVMGSIRARSPGVIHGDAVSVGGRLEVEDGATVKGNTQEVAIAGMKMPRAEWIQKWLANCVLMLRPLAPQVGWVWGVALLYFLLFLFVAVVFRHPVQCCLDELTHRPATTFLMGLLTKLLIPLIIIILLILVIGIVVVPFLGAALVVLGLVGKVAVLEWIGFRLGSLFGKEPLQQPVVALIIGSAVLAILYMIPVVGLLTMLLLSVWSLGCAMTAAFGGFRRELPARQPPASSNPSPGPANQPAPAAVSPSQSAMPEALSAMPSSASFSSPGTSEATTAHTAPSVGDPPVMPDVLVYPKATFWERIAALFLDVVLVVILGSIVGSFTATLIIGLAYVTGLWTWRGTTIGGIVLGLKVVRMEGGPVTFAVALVRGLSAAFSAIVLFLGFFWIAWDRDKQGWHDKIAGTVVLRLPRGTPLVCI